MIPVLSVRSRSWAAVVNICGGSCGGDWGGARPPGGGGACPPCGGASEMVRFSMIFYLMNASLDNAAYNIVIEFVA